MQNEVQQGRENVRTVRQTPATEYTGEMVETTVTLPSGTKFTVSATGAYQPFGPLSLRPPQVNWSAIGSVDVADALAAADALKMVALDAAGLVASAQVRSAS